MVRRELVLVADDNRDAREMYALYLEHVGLDVVTAADGQDAVLKSGRLRPDVIVMDLTMPGMDGWSAIRTLKGDAELGTIPVVALSGQSAPEAVEQARAAGCDRYVLKPCLPDALVGIIEEVLEERRRARR